MREKLFLDWVCELDSADSSGEPGRVVVRRPGREQARGLGDELADGQPSSSNPLKEASALHPIRSLILQYQSEHWFPILKRCSPQYQATNLIYSERPHSGSPEHTQKCVLSPNIIVEVI